MEKVFDILICATVVVCLAAVVVVIVRFLAEAGC